MNIWKDGIHKYRSPESLPSWNQVVQGRGDDQLRLGRNFLRKALYGVFTWAEIEPVYGKSWAESLAKANAARSEAAKHRLRS